MRIALIALHFAEYATTLARALARSESHQVLLVLSQDNLRNELEDRTLLQRLPRLTTFVVPRTQNPLLIPMRALQLLRRLKSFDADVVHCQEDTRDYLALAMPFLGHVPMVLTVHDPTPHSGVDAARVERSRHGLYRLQLRRRADAFVVHGTQLMSTTTQAIPRAIGRLYAISHGPLGMLSPLPPNRDWQIGNCLFFGRIEQYKGLIYFVEAIRILSREGLAVVGVIAGRGSELDRMKSELLSDPAFRLLDHYLTPSEVRQCFSEAQIVVAPYVDATQSGVLAYGLGFGRAMVATSVGALPDIVRHGVTGILVPPRDARALADAIRTIVLDPTVANNMAQAAAALGRGEMSWDRIAAQTLEVYKDVLDACPHAPRGDASRSPRSRVKADET